MDVHNEAKKYRQKIVAIATAIDIKYKDSVSVSAVNEWEELSRNVKTIACSLDTEKQTVLNVRFEKGGVIPLRQNDRRLSIHIIDGEIYESVSKKIYRKGDSPLLIPPRTDYEIISNNALLTMVFEPAYTLVD